jgi:hypothetical protein
VVVREHHDEVLVLGSDRGRLSINADSVGGRDDVVAGAFERNEQSVRLDAREVLGVGACAGSAAEIEDIAARRSAVSRRRIRMRPS